ncbi:hypothetical protein MUN81_07185 [Hymenobacter sp. 5317J-9]|uniref:hypothetical protein n=1 Tax=Hymenobacter sp. 5317J-9 TaxID=2932250 RepID=UPI001FD66A88|nr:hypothetical protein [Hymenobacter sp. 5317J-9]UOQ99274.1 hypothetical protein MUN81_07185 [Hymenobacter sp. 5317J-9]
MNRTYPISRFLLRLGLVLALAPFVALMAFNHPFFDDFRTAYWTHEHGAWGMQRWFYLTWSGRFTSTFFMTVLNPVTYGWLEGVRPAVFLIFGLQWASIAFLLRTVFHTVLRASFTWGTAHWTTALLLAVFCNATAAPFSFLYWFCGVVVYQLTLLSLLTFAALALRAGWGPAPAQWRSAGWACVPLVLAVAGNELTMLQAVPVLALLGYALPRAARPKWWLWLAVAGATAAAAVLAPGNWLRVAATAPPTDPLHAYRWLVLGPRTAYTMALFLLQPLNALSLLAAVAAGLWLGLRSGASALSQRVAAWPRRHWWALLLAFGALHTAGVLLFRLVLVGPPLHRARNEMLLLLLVTALALAWLVAQHPAVAQRARRLRRYAPALGLLAGLFVVGNVPVAWRELATAAAPFDAQMQTRYTLLRQAARAGQPTVTLPPLRLPTARLLMPLRQFTPPRNLEFDIDLTTGCDGNINDVTERYFHVPNVCCDPQAPSIVPR